MYYKSNIKDKGQDMKKISKPIIISVAGTLVFALSITLTAIIFKGEDTTKYKDEIATLQTKIDDAQAESDSKDERLTTCINVMNNSILANAYFLVGFTDTANISKYYSLATEAMNKYDSTDTDACRDGN